MTRRGFLTLLALIGIGCMQMVGDVFHLPVVKAFGAATGASPAPKVFTAQDGFETYANRFFLEWQDGAGGEHAFELTPEVYSSMKGPYNRRNVYGAVFSYAPVLDANPLTRPMFRAVVQHVFCGRPSVLSEVGVPLDAVGSGSLRIRLVPRRAAAAQRFALVYEVRCNG